MVHREEGLEPASGPLGREAFQVRLRHPLPQGGKPDALSRRPDYVSENSAQEPSPILKPGQLATNASKVEPGETLENADLRRSIREALPRDPVARAHLKSLPSGFSEEGGLLLKGGLVYVPHDVEIKLRILEGCHDGRPAGHLGQEKTLELVQRDYVWPGMREFVNKYILTCDACASNKAPRHRRHGQLQPLPIPDGPWRSVHCGATSIPRP